MLLLAQLFAALSRLQLFSIAQRVRASECDTTDTTMKCDIFAAIFGYFLVSRQLTGGWTPATRHCSTVHRVASHFSTLCIRARSKLVKIQLQWRARSRSPFARWSCSMSVCHVWQWLLYLAACSQYHITFERENYNFSTRFCSCVVVFSAAAAVHVFAFVLLLIIQHQAHLFTLKFTSHEFSLSLLLVPS